MYLSSKMCFDRRIYLEYNDIERIWVEVICRFARNFLLCCMYRPLSSSHCLANNFNDCMQGMLSTATAENKKVFVLAGLNVNYFVKKDNRDFKEILAPLGMKQMATDATRTCETTKTQNDTIASNNCKNIRSVNVSPSGFSDHDLIGCIRKVHHLRLVEVHDTNDLNIAMKAFRKITSTSIDTNAQMISERAKSKRATRLTAQTKALMNGRDKLYRKS